jgi:uncharacterized protein (TIGR03437 family)
VTLLAWLLLCQLPSSLPVYHPESLVNSASQTNDRFAPNSVATLYGVNLSFNTAAFSPAPEPRPGWRYPDELGGVRLLLGTERLELFYVSPTQINFRLPVGLRASTNFLQLVRDGVAGPRISFRSRDVAPELFTTPDHWILATRVDGTLVTEDKPVRPGETVVFYGTGFGPTIASSVGLQTSINWLENPSQFVVVVNGEPRLGVYYVGVTPGFSGLYQVNFTFTDAIKETNPEVRVSMRGDHSREGTRIWFMP